MLAVPSRNVNVLARPVRRSLRYLLHGTQEFGKDFVFSELHRLGGMRRYAAQVSVMGGVIVTSRFIALTCLQLVSPTLADTQRNLRHQVQSASVN
jgi:hypothetical protein